MIFFSSSRTDVLSHFEKDLMIFFSSSRTGVLSHFEENLRIFFLCSRTDVLSQVEENLTIFFPNSGSVVTFASRRTPEAFFSNSGIEEVADLDELKGDVSRPSGLMNPRPSQEGRGREEPQVFRIPRSSQKIRNFFSHPSQLTTEICIIHEPGQRISVPHGDGTF